MAVIEERRGAYIILVREYERSVNGRIILKWVLIKWMGA
jgi:hypothetical protein